MLRTGIDAFIARYPQNYRQTLVLFSPSRDQISTEQTVNIHCAHAVSAIAEEADDFEIRSVSA
jgi:hypothetical protein